MKVKELKFNVNEIPLGSSIRTENGNVICFINKKTVTIEKEKYDINLWDLQFEEISIRSWYRLNSVKKHKKMYALIINNINSKYEKEWLRQELERRKIKIKRIDMQFKQLMQAFQETGYKADINHLNEINDLLYCEAEPLLNKLEKRIEKRNNAKNIRVYKALCKIREETPIECY